MTHLAMEPAPLVLSGLGPRITMDTEPELNTATEMDWAQFNNSMEAIYSISDHDSDLWDDKVQ